MSVTVRSEQTYHVPHRASPYERTAAFIDNLKLSGRSLFLKAFQGRSIADTYQANGKL